MDISKLPKIASNPNLVAQNFRGYTCTYIKNIVFEKSLIVITTKQCVFR
jgi:hypothetical protein